MNPRRIILILLVMALLIGCAQATVLVVTVRDASSAASISGASVYINGDYMGSTDAAGQYSYSHTFSTSLNLKVTKAGYQNFLDVVSSEATSILAELSRKEETLTVVVYDADTLSPVQDALVKVTGPDVSASEQTDASGEADFQVTSGASYNINIVAAHYDPLTKTVEMGTESKEVQYWLFRSDLFAIRVMDEDSASPLAGATVYINSVTKGTTDSDGLLSIYLEREASYQVKIEKDQYQAYLEQRYIGVDDALLQVSLSKYRYPVTVSVFDVEKKPVNGAEAVLDGVTLGTSDSYGRCGMTNLIAGTHSLEVRAEGYKTYGETFTIASTGIEIAAELVYNDASLLVTVEDDSHHVLSGVSILVDGSPAGVTNANGQMTAILPAYKSYNITAVLEGYATSSADADLPFGTAQQSVTVMMQKNLDLGFIVIIVVIIGAIGIAAYLFMQRARQPKRRPVKRSKL